MNRRSFSAVRKTLIGLVLFSAIFGWVLMAINTVGLAQQVLTPPTVPTAAATSVVPTSVALFSPTSSAAPIFPDVSSAGAAQTPAVHPKTGRYIAAWLPDSFSGENRKSFEENADIIDEVSPFWYTPTAGGGLQFGQDARDMTLVELAHSKNVLVIPSVHNVVNGVDPVPALLRNPDARQLHIRNIVNEVLAYNYDGFDIDFEALDTSLRAEYTAFVTDLAAALHEHEKILTIAVHAKTSDYGGLGGFQDWPALGKVVDRLRIMTYDYHWRGGGPGPVAPVYWVSEVAEYASSVVDPSKVIIGVPFYGYNWPLGGGEAYGQTWNIINDIIRSRGLTVNLQESDAGREVQENWITYNGREVWFSTSRGLEAKISLVQRLDLAGIAIWRLGGEDPQNWTVIRNKLAQDPFESQRSINRVLPEP
jgi:spore germination protein YaaH